jgi:hypothetical protein
VGVVVNTNFSYYCHHWWTLIKGELWMRYSHVMIVHEKKGKVLFRCLYLRHSDVYRLYSTVPIAFNYAGLYACCTVVVLPIPCELHWWTLLLAISRIWWNWTTIFFLHFTNDLECFEIVSLSFFVLVKKKEK